MDNTVTFCLLYGILLVFASVTIGSHVGQNPFSGNVYNVTSLKLSPFDHDCPLQSTVYYPNVTGTFQPIYFIGGVAGLVAAESYSDFLEGVASQGYIVMGIDRLALPGDQVKSKSWLGHLEPKKLATGADTFTAQAFWLRNFLTSKDIVSPDWSKTTIMCHSEGCDVTLKMILNDTSITQAVVYLEPFSITSKTISSIPVKIPSLSYVAALSEIFPACCIKGFGYRRFYDLMNCTKVKMDVQGFGHCDILNHKDWALCHKVGVCQTTNDTRLSEYRHFLQGTVVSFLHWTLDGEVSAKKYVTDAKFIPMSLLDLAYKETCL